MIIKLSNANEVTLNPEDLQFSQATLNDFLQKCAACFSYYSEKCADAQFILGLYEDKYEQIYSERFRFYKDQGGSDKLAESSAKCDKDVTNAAQKLRKARHNRDLVNGFLRSLDKAHVSALNLGYNIRKELDKLGGNQIRSYEQILEQS